MVRLAEFLGIRCEALPLPKGVAQHAEYLAKATPDQQSCVVVNPRVMQEWLGSDSLPADLVSLLVSRFPYVVVHGLRAETVDTNIVAALSGGRLRSVQAIDRGNANYEVAEDSRDVCGPFSGLSFGPVNAANDHILAGPAGDPAVRTLISIGGHPFMGAVRQEGREILFLASADVAELDAEVGVAPLSEYFSQLLPQAMALRRVGGSECWRPSEHHAAIIIDDPLLRKNYGFLNFESLLALAKKHNFHTTIAFIPHNFRRSSPKITRMFRENTARLAICFHGNDHTGAEFASTDTALLDTMLHIAERRIALHSKLTGLECDRVMVFPQGNFSVEAMSVLKSHNFHAAVNTVHHPAGHPLRLTIRELAQPAVLRYGNFPLFIRRPIDQNQSHDIAFNLFFGRPVLIVEHHDVFQRPESLAEVATRINSVEPGIHWSNLAAAVDNSILRRRAPDGSHQVRAYASAVRITNDLTSSERFSVEWVQSSPGALVEQVLQDGTPCRSFEVDDAGTHLTVELAPGSSQTLTLVHRNAHVTPRNLGFRRNVKAFVRRRLCEARDNYLCKNPRILNVARALVPRF